MTGAASIRRSTPRIKPAPRTSRMTGCFRASVQPSLEVRADGFHVLDQTVIHQLLEEECRGPCGEQVAAMRAAVIAGRNRACHAFGDQRRAHGHARAQRLADRNQIRLPAECL